MIDKREILATSRQMSLTPHVVEKDYVLGWMLAGIYGHEDLAENWRRFHSEVQHQPARGEARAAAVPSPGGVASLPGRCKPCRALSAARRTQGGRSPTGGRRAADSAHLPSEPPPAAPEGHLRAAAPGGRPRTG